MDEFSSSPSVTSSVRPVRRTALLALMVLGSGLATGSAAASEAGARKAYPPLPEAVASFGAAVAGDWLYVYGGHVGQTHQHSKANLASGFRRLNLAEGGAWQELAYGEGLQGLPLVAHEGHVYRVGGLAARNAPEEEEDLHSVATFARYDPAADRWQELTPLPEPRSSHDAVVWDGKVYVIGGWTLDHGGAEHKTWRNTPWVADLSASPIEWRALPAQPGGRRALAAAVLDGKLYAMGGIQEAGGTSDAVQVLDLASETWSDGPALPAHEGLKGFGASAFTAGGRLWASLSDGKLYRLDLAAEGGPAWEQTGFELATPRFFHRMLPHGDGLIFVGGAHRDGHLDDIETVSLARIETLTPKTRTHAAEVAAHTARWPAFRGEGDSHTPENVEGARLPLEWSESENLAWSVTVPGYGQSSPVVWGSQAFVTSVEGEKKEHLIVSAFDVASGEVTWRRRFPASQEIKYSDMVSRAAPTPAVDGQRLYVFFESGDLLALDHEGGTLWQRSLTREYGEFRGNHGVGSSLALTEDAVLVLVAHEGPSYLLAADKATGANRFKVERPEKVAWSSPVVSTYEGREEILISAAGTVEAYDAASGERLWYVHGIEGNTIPSPSAAGELVVIGSKDANNSLAIRRGGAGDVSASHVAWRAASAPAYFASPLVHGGCALFVNRAGVARCVDLASGEERWEYRLPGACWASPIAAGDRVYFFSDKGTATVMRLTTAGAEPLAENSLPTEDHVYGVAAVEDGFLIRTGESLTKVAATPAAADNPRVATTR